VRSGRKKKATSQRQNLRPGQKVVLKKLPPGFIDDLPSEDQQAISAIVGVPVLFSGFDEIGRLELEFVERDGTGHHIYVNREFVSAKNFASSKLTKRRK